MKRFPLTDQALEWLERHAGGDCCFVRGTRGNRYQWSFMGMTLKRLWRILEPHLKRCFWCELPINTLTETHVMDGVYPDQNCWHADCWNVSRDPGARDTQQGPEISAEPDTPFGGSI